MSLPEPSELLAAARRAVELSDAHETEVTIATEADRFVRYADSGPTQSADRERLDVSIRVRDQASDGRREARVQCGSLSEPGIQRALTRATILALAAPPDPDLVPLGGPVDVPSTEPAAATAAHSLAAKADWIAQAVGRATASSLAPAGLARTTVQSRTLVNSAGRAVQGWKSRASFSLTASHALGSGWAEVIDADVDALDVDGAIERAVTTALQNRDPIAIEPGDYTVVLQPAAVSAMLLFASYRGFGAREVAESSSFLCDRIGEQLFDERVTITDDAKNGRYAGLPFDGEGSPRTCVELVDRGVLGRPVTDRMWSARLGVPNTGHALPQPDSDGPKAQNLVVRPGDATIDDLIGGVERGLFVNQFHYTNMIEPRELTLTGMTRNGTFLIENGRIGAPVKNLRFTQSLVDALAQVSGVGRNAEVAGALFDGEVVTPALRIERFRFTSTTDF